jgi:signal peptidase I
MNGLSQITEGLANLSVKTVLIVVGALLLALTTFRASGRSRDRTSDWLIENIQVVLSVVVVVFLIIRPFLFQAFYIPSSSMENTLKGPPEDARGRPRETTGDRLLVNKLIYFVSDPRRKDIAVFKAPKNASPEEKEFIKRVIGMPGDTVEVIAPRIVADQKTILRLSNEGPNGGLSLADKSEPRVEDSGRTATLSVGYASTPLRMIADSNANVQYTPFDVFVDGKSELHDPNGRIQQSEGFTTYGGDADSDGNLYSIDGEPRLAVVRAQRLAYDPGHVLVNGERQVEPYIKETPRYGMAPRKLGPREYFMMGDNRNNSNDSHVWGALDRSRFIGRAEILFWPLQRRRLFHWWLLIFLAALFAGYQGVLKLLAPK